MAGLLELRIDRHVQQATLFGWLQAIRNGRHVLERRRQFSVRENPKSARLFRDEQAAIGQKRHPPGEFERSQPFDSYARRRTQLYIARTGLRDGERGNVAAIAAARIENDIDVLLLKHTFQLPAS
jgi:hypothetical protein